MTLIPPRTKSININLKKKMAQLKTTLPTTPQMTNSLATKK